MSGPVRDPWYKRPLPLPKFLPSWLAVSLVIGIAFGVTAYFFIEVQKPLQLVACAFAAGFALMVFLFSWMPHSPPKVDGKPPSFSRPPVWVSVPIIEAFLMFVVSSALKGQSINLGRVGRGPRLTGDNAVAFGWLLALGMLAYNALTLVMRPRKQAHIVAGILGFLVVGSGLFIIMW